MEAWIRECRSCGGGIADAEFKEHRAVRIMRRDYCGSCADRITRRKTPFLFREHPLLTAAVAISVLLAAVLLALLAGRPPA